MNEPISPKELQRADGYETPYDKADIMSEPCEYRCKTCKWWGIQPNPSGDKASRECMNWAKIGHNTTGLDAVTYSGKKCGSFWTGLDFGCVHHARRTP